MTRTHELSQPIFDQLASGGGGPDGVAALRSVQLSKHLVLIGHLLNRWSGPPSERDSIVNALDQARIKQPHRFSEVLGAPLVGAWLTIAVRADTDPAASATDLGHLAAVAVVACAATGVDFSATVPIRAGLVSVPGLGAAWVGTTRSACLASENARLTVRSDAKVVEVPADPAEPAPDWHPVRQLEGVANGLRIELALDDLDPYRHGHHAPPAQRLTLDAVRHWRQLFTDAWALLAEQVPERAMELTIGLQALIPLVPEKGCARSATIRHAFGVFGLTKPASAADFAVTLVHEFQHSKLSAMLDVTPFSDPGDRRRYFAPWRTDPRPIAALLQGVYAFVGVADTWRALRRVEGLAAEAEARFAEARLQVHSGLTSAATSDALTPAGSALVARLRETTDAMLAEPVPPTVARAAEQALTRTHQNWLEHNKALN